MPPRPTGVTLIAVYEFITALVLLLASCVILFFLAPALLFTATNQQEVWSSLVLALLLFGFCVALAIGSAVVGWGLLLQERWSRIGAMILAVPTLVGFPFWTVASIALVVYLMTAEGRAAFRPLPDSLDLIEEPAHSLHEREPPTP